MKNYVYNFGGGKADGDGKMKEVLGGKGAGLAEMSKAGVPVPPGFTISTEVCNIFFENGNKVPSEINDQVLAGLRKLEKQIGKKLGRPAAGQMKSWMKRGLPWPIFSTPHAPRRSSSAIT
jgi:pyruvate,orthophosphate dikinase